MAIGHASGNTKTDFQPGGGIVGKQDWNYSGGITKAQSFSPDRFGGATPATAGLSFFRNRAYDARTWRWMQEDPIGVTGGVNLYQFNGNNPVAYVDPFGLCPKDKGGDGKTEGLEDCPKGSEGWKEHQEALAKRDAAVNACVARNTAWMKSENALVTGVVGVGGSVAAIGGGLVAKAQGAQLVAQGTVELDLFFATPKASSALVEGGIATRGAGTALINTGKGLLKRRPCDTRRPSHVWRVVFGHYYRTL